MRSQHEQEQLKKAMKENQQFFGAYMQEVGNKRQLMQFAFDFVGKMPLERKPDGTATVPEIDTVLGNVRKVYNLLLEVGEMTDLAAKIQLV